MLKNPLALAQIGIERLSDLLQPLVSDAPCSIPELSCLSPRLGNLLLRRFVSQQQNDLWQANDHFLSLFRKEDDDDDDSDR